MPPPPPNTRLTAADIRALTGEAALIPTDLPVKPARARRNDPETSHEAAASVKIRKNQQLVLEALMVLGPATHEEIIAKLADLGVEMSPSGVRTRCKELVDLKLARDTGRTKKLASGRRSILWVALRSDTQTELELFK